MRLLFLFIAILVLHFRCAFSEASDTDSSVKSVRASDNSASAASSSGSSRSATSSSKGGKNKLANAKRLHCVGDSLVYGSGASNRNRTSFPAILNEYFKQGTSNPHQVINYGSRNKTVIRNIAGSYWNSNTYQKSLTNNPSTVVLSFGFDVVDKSKFNVSSFISDYHALIESYRNLSSQPRVFVVIPPPIYNKLSKFRANLINKLLPNRIKELCGRFNNVACVDLFRAMGSERLLKPYFYHIYRNGTSTPTIGTYPNDLGYMEIAHVVAVAILGSEAFSLRSKVRRSKALSESYKAHVAQIKSFESALPADVNSSNYHFFHGKGGNPNSLLRTAVVVTKPEVPTSTQQKPKQVALPVLSTPLTPPSLPMQQATATASSPSTSAATPVKSDGADGETNAAGASVLRSEYYSVVGAIAMIATVAVAVMGL